MSTTPHIPVSWGELIDKLTILEIKVERLPGASGQANAAHELALLRVVAAPVLVGDCAALTAELKAVNLALWEIEDRIRAHERDGDFGPAFVALARSVYRNNDLRGALKRQINLLLKSELIEEKGYQPY